MVDLSSEAIQVINANLEKLRAERHTGSASLLIQWLTETAKKKALPDLPQRISRMSKDIQSMCESMRIECVKGVFVVKTSGSAEQTYKKLRYGTNWFEPNLNLTTQILAGLDDTPGSTIL